MRSDKRGFGGIQISISLFVCIIIHQICDSLPDAIMIIPNNFVVIPILEGMKEPDKFPMVMNLGLPIVACIFILIGAIGYSAFGDTTYASVVANLPAVPLSTAVQLLYALAMILTSPFMLYPALTIVEQGLYGKHGLFGCHSGRLSPKWKWIKNFTRSMVAVVCAVVSFAVGPSGLDKFVALVGSVACMPLCFIFPGKYFRSTNSIIMFVVLNG